MKRVGIILYCERPNSKNIGLIPKIFLDRKLWLIVSEQFWSLHFFLERTLKNSSNFPRLFHKLPLASHKHITKTGNHHNKLLTSYFFLYIFSVFETYLSVVLCSSRNHEAKDLVYLEPAFMSIEPFYEK